MIGSSQQMGAGPQELNERSPEGQQFQEKIKSKSQAAADRLTGFIKKFEFRPTKKRMLIFGAFIIFIVSIYFALALLAQEEPEKPPEIVVEKVQTEATTEAQMSPEREELEKAVNTFQEEIDKLSNFENEYAPPQVDLGVEFN